MSNPPSPFAQVVHVVDVDPSSTLKKRHEETHLPSTSRREKVRHGVYNCTIAVHKKLTSYVSQTILPVIHEQESKAAMSKLGNQADGLKEAIRLIESAGFSVVSAQSYAGHEKALESECAFIVDNLKVRWKCCV